MDPATTPGPRKPAVERGVDVSQLLFECESSRRASARRPDRPACGASAVTAEPVNEPSTPAVTTSRRLIMDPPTSRLASTAQSRWLRLARRVRRPQSCLGRTNIAQMKWGLGLGGLGAWACLALSAWPHGHRPRRLTPASHSTSPPTGRPTSATCATSWRCRFPTRSPSPLTGTTTIRFTLKDPKAPLVIDFETSRDHVKSVDANGKPAAFTYVNGHIVVPAASLVARRQHDPHRVQCRRRLAQSQQRFSLHAVRAGPRPGGPAGVRSARPEGPLVGHARASGDVAVGRQRRRAVAHHQRRAHDGDVCGNAAAADVPRGVHRRRFQDRDRRAQRAHVSDVPPRDRRRQGGAQSRGDLRLARPRARVSRDATPPFRTRSASSTSSPFRRSSSAAWSTPARSSTTRRGCCSTNRPRRTRCSAARR